MIFALYGILIGVNRCDAMRPFCKYTAYCPNIEPRALGEISLSLAPQGGNFCLLEHIRRCLLQAAIHSSSYPHRRAVLFPLSLPPPLLPIHLKGRNIITRKRANRGETKARSGPYFPLGKSRRSRWKGDIETASPVYQMYRVAHLPEYAPRIRESLPPSVANSNATGASVRSDWRDAVS